jgi:predicted SAM-dependent methyltransferase
MGQPVRLHLAAGDKYWPGWVNVDLHGEQDVNSDIRSLPFESNYADEIQAHHVIEHLHRKDTGPALGEWFRVLKPDGKLVLEMPCLDKIAKLIVDGEKNQRLTLLGLFGDPRDPKPDMLHKWCYSKAELTEVLCGVGFRDIKVMEPVFHLPPRDFRIEAVK